MSNSPSLVPPRGMRDFYPDAMALRTRIFDAWRAAAVLFGFEAYDACVVESLALLQRKGGEEIARQIYAFEDKSGRALALRPEMTPTLARMIVARQGALIFPVRWFTIAQCFRYERMTRGRKREHFQWNLDIVGENRVTAEAEILAAACAAMHAMGLSDDAFRVHVSSRALLSEMLAKLGIAPEHHAAIFLALDKRGKIPEAEIRELLTAEGLDEGAITLTVELLAVESLNDAAAIAGADSVAMADLQTLFEILSDYGIRDRFTFDVSVVRGLAYYTGIVFEAFDTRGALRAIFGGGRYDNLLTQMGGNPMSAVGLGFGDVVIAELLTDLGISGHDARHGTSIGYMDEALRPAATRLAAKLRREGEAVRLDLEARKPKSFFSHCDKAKAAQAAYLGSNEVAAGVAQLKDLTTREQRAVPIP